MLDIFFGTGTIAVRKNAFAKVASYEKEGYMLQRIDAESYSPGLCRDIAQSASLFGEKMVYLIDTPSASLILKEEVESALEAFRESAHVFVVVEGTLQAVTKKLYTKFAGSIEEIVGDPNESFNPFALADALLEKDKKRLWILYWQAVEAGLSAEELIGTLWWQLKTVRLAQVTKTAAEADIKDFPYNKAKRALRNFKEGELETISHNLLTLYHEGHGGKKDIEVALEKWILTL
jgi:DNA polymerase III delta subunit